MGGVTIAIARAAADTGGGNQDITTTDLGGLTPKAAFFIVSRASEDGVAAIDAVLGIGAATSTSQRWACCSGSNNNDADTDVGKNAVTDQAVLVVYAENGGVDGEADFVAFIENGVRINWGNALGIAMLITVVFFAGDDVQAYAGVYTPGTTVDAGVDVTAPGFEPDIVLLSTHTAAFNDTAVQEHHICFGVAVNDGSATQRCVVQRETEGQASGSPEAYLSTSYGAVQLASGAGSLSWASEIGGFDSDGFTSTLRLASAGTDQVGYLAVSVGGCNVYLGTHDTPTSTGNQASTSPGFEPQAVILGMTQLTAVDTGAVNDSAGPVGITAYTPDAAYSTAIAIEDAAATTNTQSMSDDKAANLPDDDGTTGIEAAFVSMDGTGWTLNFTATKASACKWWALAIEAEAGGGKPWYAYAQQ